MIDYYKRIAEARTVAELKAVYQDFMLAFRNNEITIEQYHNLRMAYHRAIGKNRWVPY